ncbi:hypothetical protein ACKAV7_000084 [Fusarium commune]
MRLLSLPSTLLLAANAAAAYDTLFHFGPTAQVETRSIDQIYKAALKEGGVVTAWFGGDEKNQEDAVKKAFETAFPGMKLNLTVDLSNILMTTQDFPRWKEEGALLYYAPSGFDKIYSGLKDIDAAFYGYTGIAWQLIWNANKLKGKEAPAEYIDFLAPEYKGKLALTYPNDDDSILFLFDQILNKYGETWFIKLLQQKPRWVRGAATPKHLSATPRHQEQLHLVGTAHCYSQERAAPEGAKLLQNFLLSKDFQKTNGFWPVRSDVAPPAGFPQFINEPNTDPHDFMKFMSDRERVERLRFWFEKRLGTAQGLSPLDDDL